MASSFRETLKTNLKPKPIWKLEDGLTYSSLSKWLQCREQFVLSVVEGWTPRQISIPLTFGSMFHLALEYQYVYPEHDSETVAAQACQDIHAQISSKGVLPKQERDTLARIEGMIQILFPLYCAYWSKADSQYSWLEREAKFNFDHQFTVYDLSVQDDFTFQRIPRECSVPLRGMRDGAFKNKKGLMLFETKTKTKIDPNLISGTLNYDFQTLLYCYSLQQEYGETPAGVLYNVVRRPAQRFGKKDTLRSFLHRVRTDVEKRPEYYFLRWEVAITEDDIKRFIRSSLDPILREFVTWYGRMDGDFSKRQSNDLHFTNPNALVNQYGPCELFDLITKQSSREFYRRQEPFPELGN